MTAPSEEELGAAASREAAEWLVALNTPTVSTDTISAFYAWRRESRNAQAYARAEAVWRKSGDLGDDAAIRAAVADAVAASATSARNPVFAAHWAIGALILAVGLAFWIFLLQPDHFTTRVGEQRTVSLDDGSSILVDADSDVTVRYTKNTRGVTLGHGRARFSVHHGDPRAFTVDFQGARVIATGTRFDVRADGVATSVALFDGTVRVQSKTEPAKHRDLVAGQSVTVAAGVPSAVATIPAGAADWSEGRVVFSHTPLGTAIAEINRYSVRKIVVSDPRLLGEPISGTFTAREGQTFADTVAAMFNLRDTRSDGAIVLAPR